MMMKLKLTFIAVFLLSLTTVFTRENPIQNIEIKSKSRKLCSDFRTGTFKYIDEQDGVKIIRTKKHQIEEANGRKVVMRIKWIDDCNYSLTCIDVSNEEDKCKLGKTTYTEISSIENDEVTIITRAGDCKTTSRMQLISTKTR